SNNNIISNNLAISQTSLQNTNTTNRKRKSELVQSEIHIKKKPYRTINDSEKSILDSLAIKFLNFTPTNIAINKTLTSIK
ncbi:12043_t:CDS:1, partial [Dentiscutata heterogama]